MAGQDLFTIEILDELPTGFSACVPELAIFTFGQSEEQAIERTFTHVLEKYEDLLHSPIPLDENEQTFLTLYRTKILPALVELWRLTLGSRKKINVPLARAGP